MRRVLVFIAALVLGAITAPQPAQCSESSQQSAQVPTSQKVIRDPNEYNAYMTALNTRDPSAKASAMEAFVKQYPQSVVLTDALEQAMDAYRQAGNEAKLETTARLILQRKPDAIAALAILAYLDRYKATNGDKAALQEACGYAQTGTNQVRGWQKPDEMSEADFQRMKTQMVEIFNGASGFCSLEKKDYGAAQGFYLEAIQNDANDLQDTYQLTISYLEEDPIDLRGFWYGAKAISLAGNNAATASGIARYVKAKYKKYHGQVDDWDSFATVAVSQTTPPSAQQLAKRIPRAPTLCELAVQAVRDNPPDQLSFSDKEFILAETNCSPANKDAADKVWESIQAMERNGQARLEIPAKVISATKNTLEVAVSDDNQASNKPDLHVALKEPVAEPPAPGTMVKIFGVITKYTPDPFIFTMEKGQLATSQ